MARPSSTKKVSRAAQTGGGRTTRGGQSALYWAFIALIVILGVAGVVVSRDQRLDALDAPGADVAPRPGQDHWHTAYGIYICDRFIEPITDQRDPEGIHTHADGVIHIHPIVRRAAGRNATLSKFFDAVRLDLTDTRIDVPGGETYEEGDEECDGEPGVMQLKVKGQEEVITTDIADFVFAEDRQVITIAFAPSGAEIPLPPSEPTLDNLSDVTPSTTVPVPGSVPAPGADGASTTVAGDGSGATGTTTAPPANGPTTTAAP